MPAAARARGRNVEREFVKAKPRNDAYTILLSISLLALLGGCLLLYWDYASYSSKKPPATPTFSLSPAAAAPATPAPAPAPTPGAKGGK
jgi:hypothetical protein